MVDCERVDGPLYDLAEVQELLRSGRVKFSFKAEGDYVELGFSRSDAIACVMSIQGIEYRTSLQYEKQQPFDDYVVTRHLPAEAGFGRLYIKLRISPHGGSTVYVTSFHKPR